jgi:hypothetical protein
MKKLTFGILLMTFWFHSFSQDKEWQNINYVGIRVGSVKSSINLIYNDPLISIEKEDATLRSLSFGLSFKNFSEKIGMLNVGISTDLNYVQKGGYGEFNLDINSVKVNNTLFKYIPTYIELNPLMDLNLGKKSFHVSVLAGPHFSYIIKEQITINTESINKFVQKADNKFAFGLDFGAGLDFEFGRSCIELRYMYGLGFTDIFDAQKINTNLWYDQNRASYGLLYYYYKL